jgi:hypothetical protein
MRWLFVCVLSGCIGLGASKHGFAATIDIVDKNGIALVIVQGRFVPDDISAFKAKIGPLSRAVVAFQSEGGSVLTGIQIGETIRLKNFITLVPDDTRCASACALAWLGGTKRFMSSGAQIGFHAAFDATSGQESGVGNALVGAYLTRIGLPYSAVIYITQAAPTAMTWLNLKDAERQGIDVSALELSRREYSPAPTPPRKS